MTGISDVQQRQEALTLFKEMYAPALGTGPVLDYLSHTGTDVLKGADVLKQAPTRYISSVSYPDNPIAKSLRDVARVHLAGLGTRIFYTQHGGYDTHATQGPTHPRLLGELSGALVSEITAVVQTTALVVAPSSSASALPAGCTPSTRRSTRQSSCTARISSIRLTTVGSMPRCWSNG